MEKLLVESLEIRKDEKNTEEINQGVFEERQIVLHCKFCAQEPMLIRIWPTTFLTDNYSAAESKLITAFNIFFYPAWKAVPAGKTLDFTLIFSALPREVLLFNLHEKTASGRGFFVPDIKRNKSDVYKVWI